MRALPAALLTVTNRDSATMDEAEQALGCSDWTRRRRRRSRSLSPSPS